MHIGPFGCPWPKKSWATKWSLAAASHLPTRDCSLTAHPWGRALWPPQKVLRMLESVKHLLSAYNHEGKITFQSSCPSNYNCKDHPSAVPEFGCFGAGVQPALSSQAARRRKRRRSWGLLRWRGEAGLSQALTHLPAGSWPLKAHGAASLRLLWTHPLPRFTPGSDGEKTTMGLFYSKSQVRKGKRRLCNELSRLSLGAEGTCCRR